MKKWLLQVKTKEGEWESCVITAKSVLKKTINDAINAGALEVKMHEINDTPPP